MRGSIRCLVIGVLTFGALRHLSAWNVQAGSSQMGAMSLWSALSFALAAVVDTDRSA